MAGGLFDDKEPRARGAAQASGPAACRTNCASTEYKQKISIIQHIIAKEYKILMI
jgi:hypothetical protein